MSTGAPVPCAGGHWETGPGPYDWEIAACSICKQPAAEHRDVVAHRSSDDQSGLTFAQLAAANLRRAIKWHKGGLDEWSVADWATAMAGEAGEICNAVKKLRRIEDEIANISEPDRQLSTREAAIAKIGEEIADTLIYLDLLAQRIGVDLAAAVVAKYNAVSEKYGFPDRL